MVDRVRRNPQDLVRTVLDDEELKERFLEDMRNMGILSDSPEKLPDGESEFKGYDEHKKPEIVNYTRDELIELVGSGIMPGFKQKVNIDSAIESMNDFSEDYKKAGRFYTSQAFQGMSDTIRAARDREEVELKDVPHPAIVDIILSALPMFPPSLTGLSYAFFTASLMYGFHK